MKSSKRWISGALVFAGLGLLAPASAMADRSDRNDRREYREDLRDLRDAQREYYQDKRQGASRRELARDREVIERERREVEESRRDLENNRDRWRRSDNDNYRRGWWDNWWR